MDQGHGKGVETDGKPQPPVDTQGQTTDEEGEMKSESDNYPVKNEMTETEISIREADQPADTPDSEKEKNAVKAFGNHVVLENVMDHLDHSSIKFLAATSHMVRNIIITNAAFINRSKIRIEKSTGIRPRLEPTSLHPSRFPWKHLVIQMVDWSDMDFEAILRLLPCAESLELFMEEDYYCNSGNADRLTTILSSATNIKQLSIGGEILDSFLKTNSMIPEAAYVPLQASLQQLESLHITDGLDPYPDHKYEIEGNADSFGKLLTTLAGFPTVLKSIGFERLSCGSRYSDGFQLSKYIVSILEQHKSSIKKLFLDACILDFVHLESIVFPSLKELSLVASGENLAANNFNESSDVPTVATFLSKQPPLETLSLTFEGRIESGAPLLSSLRTHGTHLKKFSLTWQLYATFVQPDDAADTLRHLSILKDFGSLQQLKFHQFADKPIFLHQKDPRCSPGQILSFIPDGIKKIDLAAAVAGNLVGDLPESIMESLGRFRCLKVLNLVQCPDAVDDKVLAYICSNLKHLQELGFSHCDQLTDVGLTGKQNGVEVGAGLNSLSGLQKLRILSCNELTTEGFLEAISFRDLRELTLIIEAEVGQEFFVKLGVQNKSLEVLEILEDFTLVAGTELPDLTSILRSQSQRFRTLSYIGRLPSLLARSYREDSVGDISFDLTIQ